MKLARINEPLRSVQLRVMLAGDLNAALELYARYYEHIHGDSVEARALIPEILRTFLDADRQFHSWSRSADRINRDTSGLRPQPTLLPRHRRDLPQ